MGHAVGTQNSCRTGRIRGYIAPSLRGLSRSWGFMGAMTMLQAGWGARRGMLANACQRNIGSWEPVWNGLDLHDVRVLDRNA